MNHLRETTTTHRDCLGVEILPTDTVLINSWGYGARNIDCGTQSKVIKFNRSRVVIIDCEDQQRAVGPTNLAVMRRDGAPGLEGNR